MNCYKVEYKGKIYIKGVYRTTAGNIPCNVCVWSKDLKCYKPKDFSLSCGQFWYIIEVK